MAKQNDLDELAARCDEAGDLLCDYADQRLKMRLAEAMEIVRAVAYSDPFNTWLPATNTPPGVVCRWCKAKALIAASVRHAPDCKYGRAQGLVAALLNTSEELNADKA